MNGLTEKDKPCKNTEDTLKRNQHVNRRNNATKCFKMFPVDG